MKKLLIALLFVCNSALASECADLYPDSKPIIVKDTVELCNSFFVSLFDKEHNRVILVSEHLKPNKETVKRADAFHSDPRIGKDPSPKQYVGTGYDKGHMAPAGDASNDKEMFETFVMTNMTPQKPMLNRVSWRVLEESTRSLLSKSKSDMFVITIAVYDNNEKMGTIPIPTGYWKIVMVDNTTHYYYADNKDYEAVVEKQNVDITTLLP